MSVAGYVLAGGNSTRMGTDKALLRLDGIALVERIAATVQKATGTVTLVGDPDKYASLGLRVIPDLRNGLGPLGGLEALLSESTNEWNLVAACDMALISCDFLKVLCSLSLELPESVDCLVPVSLNGRLQPLTAVYRRRCLKTFSEALDGGRRKVIEAVQALKATYWRTAEAQLFQNMNTPEEWNRYVNGRINQVAPR